MKNSSLSICICIPHESINGYSFEDVGPILRSVKNLAQHFSCNYSQQWRGLT